MLQLKTLVLKVYIHIVEMGLITQKSHFIARYNEFNIMSVMIYAIHSIHGT